jgi:nucleoside-diphosphate-sugar epimerase
MMIGSSNHTELNCQNMLAIEKNVIPLKKVFAYFKNRPIKKLLSFSSILLYDRSKMTLPVDESQPLSTYQNEYIFSKFLGEEVAKFYSDVPNIIVRLTNIYGPTTALDRPDLVNQLVEGLVIRKKARVLNLRPQRDFIYTADASDAETTAE